MVSFELSAVQIACISGMALQTNWTPSSGDFLCIEVTSEMSGNSTDISSVLSDGSAEVAHSG